MVMYCCSSKYFIVLFLTCVKYADPFIIIIRGLFYIPFVDWQIVIIIQGIELYHFHFRSSITESEIHITANYITDIWYRAVILYPLVFIVKGAWKDRKLKYIA